MYHPKYAWMFFNWYSGRWWYDEVNSCSADEAEKLEEVIETSIVFDHYARIEDDRRDEPNIGNIVSINYKKYKIYYTYI